jgi:hypothetical protein
MCMFYVCASCVFEGGIVHSWIRCLINSDMIWPVVYCRSTYLTIYRAGMAIGQVWPWLYARVTRCSRIPMQRSDKCCLC